MQISSSRSLSNAFKTKKYDREDICLFEKKDVLIKVEPQNAFLQETKELLDDILKIVSKKKEISTLANIVHKF